MDSTTNRDLRIKEQYDRQIKLYSPCACGSNKKFKFCCSSVPAPISEKTNENTTTEV